jgi:indoleamine 2,3-dioxygenase
MAWQSSGSDRPEHSGAGALLDPLSIYDIDPQTGFVPALDPIERLPAAFDAWEQIASELSALIRTRRLRTTLLELPLLAPLELRTARERERALLLLTVFANGWVWGAAQPDLSIPHRVAVPLCAVADALDRPPIVHYASMALHNWRRVDRRLPISADNTRMQVQFLGGVDEDWFFIGSLGVELAGAPLLPMVHDATLASHRADDSALAAALESVAEAMTPVLAALERLREWCDPHVFYHRVRPYLAGWPTPGAIYTGVSETPRKYVGGSAGQSSLIQAIDALLGIEHGAVTGPYLRLVRQYMPTGHRRFVQAVEETTRVRTRAAGGSPRLSAAYNSAAQQVDSFRRQHMRLAHDFIAQPSGMKSAAKGTGGTTFVDFLQDAQRETAHAAITSTTR